MKHFKRKNNWRVITISGLFLLKVILSQKLSNAESYLFQASFEMEQNSEVPGI